MTFITKKNFSYRLQQLLILVAHLVLLKWILYVLNNGGLMQMQAVLLHFFGMSLYGAMLIRGTALWAKHRFIKEQRARRKEG